jgi:hypothetical protein
MNIGSNPLREASGDYYYYDYHGGYGADGAPKDGRNETGRDRDKGRGSVPPIASVGVKRE